MINFYKHLFLMILHYFVIEAQLILKLGVKNIKPNIKRNVLDMLSNLKYRFMIFYYFFCLYFQMFGVIIGMKYFKKFITMMYR